VEYPFEQAHKRLPPQRPGRILAQQHQLAFDAAHARYSDQRVEQHAEQRGFAIAGAPVRPHVDVGDQAFMVFQNGAAIARDFAPVQQSRAAKIPRVGQLAYPAGEPRKIAVQLQVPFDRFFEEQRIQFAPAQMADIDDLRY
jgi:hypothetical protein